MPEPLKIGILLGVPLPPTLLLKVVQSAAVSNPLLETLALGKLNVCTPAALLIVKSVPVEPTANV